MKHKFWWQANWDLQRENSFCSYFSRSFPYSLSHSCARERSLSLPLAFTPLPTLPLCRVYTLHIHSDIAVFSNKHTKSNVCFKLLLFWCSFADSSPFDSSTGRRYHVSCHSVAPNVIFSANFRPHMRFPVHMAYHLNVPFATQPVFCRQTKIFFSSQMGEIR